MLFLASSLVSSDRSTAEGSQDRRCGLLVATVGVTTAGDNEGLDGTDLSGVTTSYRWLTRCIVIYLQNKQKTLMVSIVLEKKKKRGISLYFFLM